MLSRHDCGRRGRKREALQPTRRVIRRKNEAVRGSARIEQSPDMPPGHESDSLESSQGSRD
jgi:hypothetical protein